jgi:hypothetical protein
MVPMVRNRVILTYLDRPRQLLSFDVLQYNGTKLGDFLLFLGPLRALFTGPEALKPFLFRFVCSEAFYRHPKVLDSDQRKSFGVGGAAPPSHKSFPSNALTFHTSLLALGVLTPTPKSTCKSSQMNRPFIRGNRFGGLRPPKVFLVTPYTTFQTGSL